MSTKTRPFSLEKLEDRLAPAVQAFFNDGLLTVLGDGQNNNILVAADSSGNLVVTEQGQAVTIVSQLGQATRANLNHLVIEGRAGNDIISTDASLNTLTNGVLSRAPTASLLGGGGHDTISAKHGGIVGGLAGVNLATGDVIGPVAGNCYMDGGAGNDSLTSGFGNDTMLGGSGDDSYTWPPGTLTDVWEGGDGNDTVTVIGNDSFLGAPAGDRFALSANGNRVLFQRLNLVKFNVDIGTTETVVLKPGAGDDVVTIEDLTGASSIRKVVVEGAAGNDVIDGSRQARSSLFMEFYGGDGDDTLLGGASRDLLSGGDGNDTLNGGGGSDTLYGGDGDDCLDGGAGTDTLIGGTGADQFAKRRNDTFVDLDAAENDAFALV